MAAKSHSRAAAWTATAVLTVTGAFQLYWGLGGMWGLDQSSVATSSTAAHIGAVIIGLVAFAAAGVLLIRVGYWHGHVPLAVVGLTRLLVFVAFGGALAQFSERGFVGGTINLIVALLAFLVARSDLPASPTSVATRTPSRKPGPPTPTH